MPAGRRGVERDDLAPAPVERSERRSRSASTAQVRALVLGGYGLNCDAETAHVCRLAGADAQRVHINELIDGKQRLESFHILALIGGFAWADDHGAGVVLATKLRRHLGEALLRFIAAGRYVIGICNGFQALVNLGILPGFEVGRFRREVALTYNDCGNFRDQWVQLRVERTPCVFDPRARQIELPVRHAEGKFVAPPDVLTRLREQRQIVMRYARPTGEAAGGEFPWNPNGAQDDIAGICDPTGRIFGLMPHPEAYNHETNHPDWTRLRWQEDRQSAQEPPGVTLFRQAVSSAQERLLE
ncbi:MAG: phosphoribosylformylglycinamidine synthase [Candidatus Eisenbacteria bacterium]|nr:phosphoribosylformylglycinamidine synthase [Candidatus Eisenbacteria bacterium]